MNRESKNYKIKKFSTKMQAKLLLVFCVIIIAMLGLIGRLVYLNRTDGDRYAKKVLSQQTYNSTVIPYQRGSILDRKGTVLATSEKVYNIILDVKYMLLEEDYLTPTITALTECYGDITSESIMEIVETKPNSQYVILKKKLNYDEMMLFKDKAAEDENIQGVWFEEDYIRKYPYSTLASDVIGFTSSGNVGNWGIEQNYNEELNGTNGREYGYIDSELKLERTVKPATNGNTIVTTIDANVQGIVQNHIKAYNEEFGSKNIGVLIMNPNNGEIIAMASNEEYDLNNPNDLSAFYSKKEIEGMKEDEKLKALNAIWRNFVISDAYEPGSTFKPFTIAAGLEEDDISETDTYICDGLQMFGSTRIRCNKRTGHGKITLSQALQLSCNDALMQIVEKEGRSTFYEYQNFFGFGDKTGIDLPGEAKGILVEKDKLNSTELATSSFGQTFATTMIQMAAGFSSLVNGGYYYEPHMVKQILNDQGVTVKNIDKNIVKETVSKQTSDFIQEAMYLTVKEGTATTAQVSGYKVGGKTGTAQKIPRAALNYLVSFIGVVPADNPEIVIYVVIDEPQNVIKQADSSIATKLTSKILSEVLPFLEIYPTEKVDSNSVTTVPVLPSTNTSNKGNENVTEENAENENSTEQNEGTNNSSTEQSEDTNNSTAEQNEDINNSSTEINPDDPIEDEYNPDALPSGDEEETKEEETIE